MGGEGQLDPGAAERADVPARMEPPAASAVRRAMSRPSPVEPPVLDAPLPVVEPKPGPGVLDGHHAPTVGRRAHLHPQRGAVRRVAEDVAPARRPARRRGPRSAARTGTGSNGRSVARTGRPVSSASADQNADPLGRHRGQVGRRRRRRRGPAGGRCGSPRPPIAGQRVDVGAPAGPGRPGRAMRVHVQPQRGHRGPQPVGQVGDLLPLGRPAAPGSGLASRFSATPTRRSSGGPCSA